MELPRTKFVCLYLLIFLIDKKNINLKVPREITLIVFSDCYKRETILFLF